MLSLPSGKHDIWPQFSLEIKQPINFECGTCYWLEGPNGSGKSSMFRGVLLPHLQSSKNSIYRLYIQQFTEHQNFAIKAHAAFYKPSVKIVSDLDCITYLLNNLKEAYSKHQRDAYLLVDESKHLSFIYDYLSTSGIPYCLIYSLHDDNPLATLSKKLTFEPLSVTYSVVYESTL
jgi:ABC-type transport system involved in cytochrome c biogenesis ATPase subunit